MQSINIAHAASSSDLASVPWVYRRNRSSEISDSTVGRGVPPSRLAPSIVRPRRRRDPHQTIRVSGDERRLAFPSSGVGQVADLAPGPLAPWRPGAAFRLPHARRDSQHTQRNPPLLGLFLGLPGQTGFPVVRNTHPRILRLTPPPTCALPRRTFSPRSPRIS